MNGVTISSYEIFGNCPNECAGIGDATCTNVLLKAQNTNAMAIDWPFALDLIWAQSEEGLTGCRKRGFGYLLAMVSTLSRSVCFPCLKTRSTTLPYVASLGLIRINHFVKMS